MIIEMRTYTIQIGKFGQFAEYYAAHGLPPQQRILGNLIGYFSSDIGALNQAVQLWGYESYAERERRRAELAKDPDWLNYLKTAPQVIVSQENRILLPTAFSPIK
jgi:hypothetical protein